MHLASDIHDMPSDEEENGSFRQTNSSKRKRERNPSDDNIHANDQESQRRYQK